MFVPPGPQRLSHAEARQSPCLSCEAPCCQLLTLHKFTATTFLDIDHALYALNFADIELGLSQSMEWTVYLRRPCGFLAGGRCSIYGSPERPHICAVYNPIGCWYKRIYSRETSPDYLRIDRGRMELLTQHLVYDDDRDIVGWPSWSELVEMFAAAGLGSEREVHGGAHEAASAEAPAHASPSPDPSSAQAVTQAADPLAFAPCDSCAAHCCKILVFGQPMPTDIGSLDFFRYALGFPGVRLGISDSSWNLIVRTTCRHLTGNRCGLFGKPERPNWCTFYDEWRCTFKPRYENGRRAMPGFIEIEHSAFVNLVRLLPLSEDGQLTDIPSVAALRAGLARSSACAADIG